ncbi:dolichyl-diphosphooligosaccharide--protein glycosyltransferase subunit 1 [Dimargaris verticillata]|uniref:Dolichyl-diphosphooligosaccharide--protein glycosyltransferase subunit 1 n=1 Tax=Dimargaris verticillata TaxID=2761393 RepID=A0A9W8ECK5_9FUNG|nr:dolichyl-diphosphooligosaccharide--protein glycosyltransferase subunit 1 [Dimargaris verticillata]
MARWLTFTTAAAHGAPLWWLGLAILLLTAIIPTFGATAKSLTLPNAIPEAHLQAVDLKSISRRIHLTTATVRESISVIIKNRGTGELQDLYWVVPESEDPQVGLIYASFSKPDIPLKATRLDDVVTRSDGTAYRLYHLRLDPAMPPQQQRSLGLLIVHTAALEPLPHSIPQHGKQLLWYTGNTYVNSLYAVAKQTTEVLLPTSITESHADQPKPFRMRGTDLVYGPYKSAEPLAYAPLTVHFPHQVPAVWLPSVRRHIEISHWGGQLTVNDHAVVRNNGATLKGHYERTLMTRPGMTSGFLLNFFQTPLPATATNVHFRDEVGNVSTTFLRPGKDQAVLQFNTRYPLAGGWIYNWNHGYSQPLADVLRYDSTTQRYNLMTTLPFLFPNATVEQSMLEVVLPEGATDIHVRTAADVDNLSQDTYYTYMDSIGRPMITLARRLVVDELSQYPIIISYRYDMLALLRKPFHLALLFFVLFFFASIVSRVDYNLPNRRRGDAKAAEQSTVKVPLPESKPEVPASPETPEKSASMKRRKKKSNK